MTLVELIPSVRSLSRSDKFRLMQWIAGDLVGTDDFASNPTDQIAGIEDNEHEIREYERVCPVDLGDTLGRMEEGFADNPVNVNSGKVDQLWPFPIEAGQAIPIWLLNESYEAAAIMLKMLEERKSTS